MSGRALVWLGVHGVITAAPARILVLRRSADASYAPGLWDLPGGHLSAPNEDLLDCLTREVCEETGLQIAVHELLGVHKAAGPFLQLFYRCCVGQNCGVTKLNPEHAEARWVTLEEIESFNLIPYLTFCLSEGYLARSIDSAAGDDQ